MIALYTTLTRCESRFVDRDTFVRHVGCGVGHLETRAHDVEHILYDGFDPDATCEDEPVGGVPDGNDELEAPEVDADHDLALDEVDELYADL